MLSPMRRIVHEMRRERWSKSLTAVTKDDFIVPDSLFGWHLSHEEHWPQANGEMKKFMVYCEFTRAPR